MTMEELKQLRALHRELKQLDKSIQRLEEREVPVVSGKVRGSSHDFPYIEVRTPVLMYEPKTNDAIQKLLKMRRERREQAEKKVLEIEDFISSIPDSETRQIFELYFQEGMRQQDIAEKLNIERSTVSKKINTYINFHTNHIFK